MDGTAKPERVGVMVNSKVKLLLAVGLVAMLGAMISSFAAGSRFHLGRDQGSYNYDVRVGAGDSGPATFLGLVAMASLLGAVCLHLAKSANVSNTTAPGHSASRAMGFSDFAATLRRVTKSKTDIWVGGVCGGLGEHTSLPPWVWRFLFLFFLFCYGVGLPLYLCLWICLPAAADDAHSSANCARTTPYGTR